MRVEPKANPYQAIEVPSPTPTTASATEPLGFENHLKAVGCLLGILIAIAWGMNTPRNVNVPPITHLAVNSILCIILSFLFGFVGAIVGRAIDSAKLNENDFD